MAADRVERPADGADARALGSLADELLPSLMARFAAGQLGEIEVRGPGWRVRLRREAAALPVAPVRGQLDVEQRRGRGAGQGSPGAGDGQGQARDRGRSVVTSPAVGYYQPLDGLEVGRSVRQGDALGHVDVLGIRHDVLSSQDGVIGRSLVEPGQAVEYGQELVRIDRTAAAPA